MKVGFLTLHELNAMVREAIEASLDEEYWVQAELSECYEKGGHCYLELVEKKEGSNTPIAKSRAMIWANRWIPIRHTFQQTTGQQLAKGMKVLLKVYPNFHEAYGFSWIVSDLDPTYTIGDLARRRQEIIKKLEYEGVLELNKQIPIPLFCQRIAVVSSASAAGYGDFMNTLNSSDYIFHTTLFEAVMQGEMVEKTVISALEAIYQQESQFDCVVIIRGGGASSDLSGFDTYNLAANVANFPLPVITGIGHERDDTVLDMVANTRVKTPTAAAEFLIQRLAEVDGYLDYASQVVSTAGIKALQMAESRLQIVSNKLHDSLRLYFAGKNHRLELLSQKLDSLDPALLLQRGYTITSLNGKIIKDANLLQDGDVIETSFKSGKVQSTVKKS